MLSEVVELLQHMVMEVVLLVLRRQVGTMEAGGALGIGVKEVLVVEQEDSHLRLLAMPSNGSACSEDPVELVVVVGCFVVSGAGGSVAGWEGLEVVDDEDVLELLEWLQVAEVEVAVGHHLHQSLEARLLE